MTYQANLNYCTLFPDKAFGVRYNYHCYLHDRQYRNEVKQRKSRLEADRDLKKGVFLEYKTANKKFIGFFMSWIIFLGAFALGFITWKREIKH